MKRLEGKIALVTGAGQGIGRAIAEAFAQEGANVIATDVQCEKLDSLPRGMSIETSVLDVTDANSIRQAVQRYSVVDVLVNCAGLVMTGSLLASSQEDLEQSFRLNVTSIFCMTQAFLSGMIERKTGSIINIASVVGTSKTAAERCVYATTKGAVLALTKSIALDFIKAGIRCNAISPGTVHTPSLEERLAAFPNPAEALQTFVSRQPMGRLGRVAEVAAAAVFLASDEAPFMTGANLVVDGGFSL